MSQCAFCKKELTLDPSLRISRQDSCPHCHRDLRCCLNCSFYEPNNHWECREDIAERVKDKEKSNFCDSFKMNSSLSSGAAQSPNVSPKDALLSAAEALFKKK